MSLGFELRDFVDKKDSAASIVILVFSRDCDPYDVDNPHRG